MINETANLKIIKRKLTEKEIAESQRIIANCQKKLEKSPAPVNFFAKIFDLFSEERTYRRIREDQNELPRRKHRGI